MTAREMSLDTLAQTGRELAASAAVLQSVLKSTGVTPEARSKLSTALANTRSSQACLFRRSGPFTRLPFDVLAEIFRIWAASYVAPEPSEDDDDEPPAYRVLPPAFTSAAVCQHWRAAALSCASLWTRITLNMRRCATDLVRYLDLMLPRTRACRLYVTLDYATHWTTDADGRKSDLLARLLARCRSLRIRWRTNDMTTGPPLEVPFAESVLPLLMAPMLHLEEVEFEGTLERITGGARILTLCPMLRKLDLQYIPFNLIDIATLSHVESFSSHLALHALDLHDISTAWPMLHSLTIHSVINPVHLQFPQLRKLRNIDATIFDSFRSSDDIPLLHTLEIGNCGAAYGRFGTFVENLSGWTSLQTVALVAADWSSPLTIPVQWYLSTLRALPDVRTLRLEGFTPSSMLEFYRHWERSPLLLGGVESLQHVKCEFCIGATTSLVNLLQHRNRTMSPELTTSSSRIKELSVRQDGEMELDRSVFPAWMKPRLEQLVERVFIDTSLVTRPRGCVQHYQLYSVTSP